MFRIFFFVFTLFLFWFDFPFYFFFRCVFVAQFFFIFAITLVFESSISMTSFFLLSQICYKLNRLKSGSSKTLALSSVIFDELEVALFVSASVTLCSPFFCSSSDMRELLCVSVFCWHFLHNFCSWSFSLCCQSYFICLFVLNYFNFLEQISFLIIQFFFFFH